MTWIILLSCFAAFCVGVACGITYMARRTRRKIRKVTGATPHWHA